MGEERLPVKEELCRVVDECDNAVHLNYCRLETLPPELTAEDTKYGDIKRIHLKCNKLCKLPEEIGNLKMLVELYLYSNNLEYLPDGVANLENLEILDVGANRLKSLPSSICRMKNLNKLHVTNNQLRSLPSGLNKLEMLEVIEAMNNKLEKLPKDLANCNSLKRLLVDRNCLHWLPRQLSQMPRLEELSAAGNQLLCLPLDIGHMKKLRSVYVDNNPYLYAVPLSLESQEVGFSNCGSANFQPYHPAREIQTNSVCISQESVDKQIHLPQELHSLGSENENSTISLMELALRAVYHKRSELKPVDAPGNLYDLIMCPTAVCLCCQRPVFTMAFPMVFDGQIQLYRLYKVGLACSKRCVKVASIAINLPLVYPMSTSLCMPVALIQD